jgi:hypothetical protein
MKRFILIFAGIIAFARLPGYALTPQPTTLPPSVVTSSFTLAAGTATVTASTPTAVGPYSLGYYNYISHIHVEMYATGTLTGGATPVVCTTTNLNSIKIYLPTAAATGSETVIDMAFDNPIQGTQGSQVTVSCPGQPSVIYNVLLTYYQGS